jgi:hypothetical protein
MSIETWRQEFYPQTAISLVYELGNFPKEDKDIYFLKHAILKWQGFLSMNLEKHDIVFEDVKNFLFGTCALCEAYCNDPDKECEECPIFLVKGRTCTDRIEKRNSADQFICSVSSLFYEGYKHQNAKPMLKLLRDVLEETKKI